MKLKRPSFPQRNRRCMLPLSVSLALGLLAPAPAHASMFQGETLDSVANVLAWVVLVFFPPLTAGAIHLLLALGGTLLVRWWARRA